MQTLRLTFATKPVQRFLAWLSTHTVLLLIIGLTIFSIWCFLYYYQNGLGIAYNDARSHLNIGRRVVEGLKPGLAQLGSVWLPLPHLLMVPTVWIDFFWHTGLSGALQSMVSYVATGVVVYKFLRKLGTDQLSAVFGTLIFALNPNIFYLQSTAMTELLLIATMTLAAYELLNWYQNQQLVTLVKAAFWVMLSTLNRYDGWFLFFNAVVLIILKAVLTHWRQPKKAWQVSEGLFIFFCTLAGFGIFFWLVWNAAIFKDPLYFAFGPYSAHAQQTQLDEAGVLLTKHHLGYSLLTYWYGMIYNSGVVPVVFSLAGAAALWLNRRVSRDLKIASTLLLGPFLFNVLALYLGHSVLFIQNLNGNTWFNVRYGVMMLPSIAVFSGYLFYRCKSLRVLLLGVFLFFAVFQIANHDAVTVDDGRVGASQKNVTEVSSWLATHSANQPGFVLISAASHDAVIFSSRLPMKKFIHEGTGTYWLNATGSPDRWARWIIMRTNDNSDQTFRLINKDSWREKYVLVNSFPFADIYQLRDEYLPTLNTQPILGHQR